MHSVRIGIALADRKAEDCITFGNHYALMSYTLTLLQDTSNLSAHQSW